mgnify:CR=1 FL=1
MNKPVRIFLGKVILTAFLGVLMISAGQNLFAQNTENSRDFLNGIRFYQQDRYEDAAGAFLKIAETGVRNGKLFYNLGNSYLKTGEIGHAILWYERAFKIIPDDPDLNFNLNFARSLVKDEREEKRAPLLKVLFFWEHLLSARTVKWTAAAGNLVFWLTLALSLLPVKTLKTALSVKIFKYLVLTVAVVFTLTAFFHYFTEQKIVHGIILPEKVSVRSGLTENATELFVLHSGTKIRIERQDRDYYRIYFSEDKIGWLKKSEAAII